MPGKEAGRVRVVVVPPTTTESTGSAVPEPRPTVKAEGGGVESAFSASLKVSVRVSPSTDADDTVGRIPSTLRDANGPSGSLHCAMRAFGVPY